MGLPNTKHILWIVAILVALSPVAGLILRKHEQPKIIGKISPHDVSEISKVVLDTDLAGIKAEIKDCFWHGEIKPLVKKIKEYNSVKLASVESWPSNAVVATLAPRTNRVDNVFYLVKDRSGWRCAKPPFILSTLVVSPATNSAPENSR